MEVNMLIPFLTAFIPIAIGAIWYSNALFGKAWMRATGITEEKQKSANMVLILGLSYVFGIMLSFAMMQWSIHQFSTQGLFATQEGFAEGTGPYFEYFKNFMSQYGGVHRTFGHGAAHGLIGGLSIALPLISINALFEQRGWKYILIHVGYWIITLMLMCGVLCQFV